MARDQGLGVDDGTVASSRGVRRTPASTGVRRPELDNLKTALTVAVITTHAILTYADAGDWFYQERNLGQAATLLVLLPGLVGALFAMGLFFLVAGLFAPGALARKGTGRFVSDRALKLGLPLVAYVTVVTPAVNALVAYRTEHISRPVLPFLLHLASHLDTGPLWFVGTLLLFSVGYAALRRVVAPGPAPDRALDVGILVSLAVAIGLASFVVRLQFPIDSHQVMNLHVFQWPQHVAMFALGVGCAERGWLRGVPTSLRRRCGLVAVAATVALVVVMAAGGAFAEDATADAFSGGWHWEAAATAVIEGALAISASIWLLGWFEHRWTGETPFSRLLARSAYGAFVWQTPVLVAIALSLRDLAVAPEVRLAVLAPSAVAGSFALSWLGGWAWRRVRPRAGGSKVGTDGPGAVDPAGRPLVRTGAHRSRSANGRW